jgi:hypothetical protein
MSHRWCVAGASAVIAMTASIAAAQECCAPSAPVVVYGVAPVPVAIPPTGYVLDPSDARKPIYVVNQGPYYSGPGIYAVPTYSEGGYAATYAAPYPYVRGYWGYGRWPHAHAYRPARAWRNPAYRPYGAPPYAAYQYRPAPSARVIKVPQPVEEEWTYGYGR